MAGYLQQERLLYARRQAAAARESVEAFSAYGVDFDIRSISAHAIEIVETQWKAAGRRCDHWNWEVICRDFLRKPSAWCFAIWSEGRLCALVAAETGNAHLYGAFIEGDPRSAAPLEQYRAIVALDLLSRYAELCGLRELRVVPLNDKLAQWYQDIAAFEPFPSRENPTYYRLEL